MFNMPIPYLELFTIITLNNKSILVVETARARDAEASCFYINVDVRVFLGRAAVRNSHEEQSCNHPFLMLSTGCNSVQIASCAGCVFVQVQSKIVGDFGLPCHGDAVIGSSVASRRPAGMFNSREENSA
jgi:hypothetical protein